MPEPVITRLDALRVGTATTPGDDLWFLRLHSQHHQGWYGPVSAAIATAARTLAPHLTARPVHEHQALYRALRDAVGPTAPTTTSWAIGALDCAAWDLHAHHTDAPVHRLLTCATPRTRVAAYLSWLSQDLTALTHDRLRALRPLTHGWAFTKWGLRATRSAGPEHHADHLARAVTTAATALGGPVAVDALTTWGPELAHAFTARLPDNALVWAEDPLPDHDTTTYQALTAQGLPLGVGEHLTTTDDATTFLSRVHPHAVTIDVVGLGGLTPALDLVHLARRLGLRLFPHGRSLMPGLHLAAAFPHEVPAVEYRHQWEPARQQRYRHPLTPAHGHLTPAPRGLGTTPRR